MPPLLLSLCLLILAIITDLHLSRHYKNREHYKLFYPLLTLNISCWLGSAVCAYHAIFH